MHFDQLNRRTFITLIGGAAAAWPLAARTQQANRIVRVGVLAPSFTPFNATSYQQDFVSELRQLGFSEGQNLSVDLRWASQDARGPFPVAAELIRSKVDLIVVDGPEIVLQAAIAASRTIPIVMLATNYDPIERGYVNSLARPGGNITGVFLRQPELAAKQVELLTQAFPDKTRLAILWDTGSADQFSAAQRTARSLGLELRTLRLENPPYDFDAAFQTLVKDGPQVLLVLSSPLFTPHQPRIAELAIQHRLATMFIFKSYVVAGGLMSYGADNTAMRRLAAGYVAKILQGTKPADLPIQLPTKFEMAVNLKTARAIGVTIPTAILLRADEVIE